MSKYSEAVEKAYRNHELIKLLSGDESYVLDEKGNNYLAEYPYMNGAPFGETDPMDLEALLSGLESFYRSLDKASGERIKLSDELRQSIIEMAASDNAVQVYFAAKLYLSLSRRNEASRLYPFKGLYKEIQKPVNDGLIRKKEELIESKIFAGLHKDRGLWDLLVMRNRAASADAQLEVLQ